MKKKILVLCLSLILVMLSFAPAIAADVSTGGTFTVSIPVNAGSCTSGGASLSYSNCTFVSGSWSIPGGAVISDVDGSHAAFAYSNATNVSGSLNITVKAGSVGDASVSASFTWGGSNSKGFSIGCATHSFTENRVEPTCTSDGKIEKTCSVCGYSETQILSKLGHSISDKKVTKEATCTEAGSQEGTCSRCGQSVKETIAAKGHKPGEFLPLTAGDCQTLGTESAVCTVCGETVIRDTVIGEHQFENPILVQEATLTKPEIYEGKCTVCGEATEQIGKCLSSDETTGLNVVCDEGVFTEGTVLKTTAIEPSDELFVLATTALDGISTKFTLFDISAYFGEEKVQPNGTVEVTFPIPEGYGKNVGLYYIGDDGSIESIGGKISADGLAFTATLNHFSCYALCVLNGASDASGSNVFMYISIFELVIILALVFLMLKSKGIIANKKESTPGKNKEEVE